MKYSDIYHSLMSMAKSRVLSGYIERHHVLPKCLGGTDDSENIVELTAREHFFAHQLLTKIHPNVSGLTYATALMSGKGVLGKYASRSYEWVRRRYAMQKSAAMKGKPRPPETMQAMRAAVKAMTKTQEHRQKIANTLRGRKTPDSVRKKLSAIRKGKKHSKAHCANMSKARSVLSEDQIREMRAEYDAGGVLDHISMKYGVSKSAGARIMKRQSHNWMIVEGQ